MPSSCFLNQPPARMSGPQQGSIFHEVNKDYNWRKVQSAAKGKKSGLIGYRKWVRG